MKALYAIAAPFTPGKPEPPARDEDYKRWIRSQASVVSGKYGCDPCHTGPHGTGQKSSDLSCIPLTRAEHREFDRAPRQFAERHGLNVPAIIAEFNRQYQQRLPARRPIVRETGAWQKRRTA